MLKSDERLKLHQALLAAFPTRDEFRMFLSFRCDVNLEIIDDGSSYAQAVFKVIGWVESEDRTQELIQKACDEKPKNKQLGELRESLFSKSSQRSLERAASTLQSASTWPNDGREIRYFVQADLYKIKDLLLRVGFAREDRLSLLFVSMDSRLLATLPDRGAPDSRLLGILDRLNRTGSLPGDEIPLRTFLFNATENAKPLQESEVLEHFLNMLPKEN